MLGRRIYLNLAAFATLFVVLLTWAAFGILKPDFLQDRYSLHAQFTDVNGLRPGVEVTHRGVRVGQVRAVEIDAGHATVELSIETTTDLHHGIGAAVRRRSAVGEPYVALTEAPGDGRRSATIPQDGSYTIPLEDTTPPLSYGQLFESAEELLTGIDKGELNTVVSELNLALGGRGQQIRRIIGRTSEATASFAARADMLERLAGGLTSFTGLLADEADTIANATDDLEVLVDSLASRSDDISLLLDRSPGIAARIERLLAASYHNLECGFDAAGDISSVVGAPDTIAQLTRLLRASQTAAEVIPKAILEGPDGRYLAGTFGFAPGDFRATYDDFAELPEPRSVAACTDEALDETGIGDESSVSDGAGRAPSATSVDALPGPAAEDEQAVPATTSQDTSTSDPIWPRIFLAAVAFAAALATAVRFIRLRHG